MDEIARCVWLAATDFENKADEIRASVTEICGQIPHLPVQTHASPSVFIHCKSRDEDGRGFFMSRSL